MWAFSSPDAFLLSEHLTPINARPIDVYYGFPDGNEGLSTDGDFHPGLHTIHAGALYRTGNAAGRRMTGEMPSTLPPWNAGPALTVTLSHTTEAAASDGSGSSLVIGQLSHPPSTQLRVLSALHWIFILMHWNVNSSFYSLSNLRDFIWTAIQECWLKEGAGGI